MQIVTIVRFLVKHLFLEIPWSAMYSTTVYYVHIVLRYLAAIRL